MKEKIKRILNIMNEQKFILILLIVILMFCWIEIRPSIIYSECHKIATEKAIEKCDCDERFQIDDYDGYYKFCIRKEGLGK